MGLSSNFERSRGAEASSSGPFERFSEAERAQAAILERPLGQLERPNKAKRAASKVPL